MCGILGAFGNIDKTKQVFQSALDTLSRRGPDAQGIFSDPLCMLGHRRLSIIDLSTGDQPMTSHDGRYTVVFNGEIYNYRHLRDVLKTSYPFCTQSDTEVILAGFAQFGAEVVQHLEGMFAFVVYDREMHSLFLARDPMGIKPLVYTCTEDAFFFASEIKALLPLQEKKQQIDTQALYDFLCLRHVPAPRTMFEDTKKLPAGHWMSVAFSPSGTQPQIEIVHYWKPTQSSQSRRISSEQFRDEFVESVKDHLVADVPVGVFLSGGVDSSAVTWAMTQVTDHVKTYTVGFTNERHDADMHFARIVATALGTEHHELWIDRETYAEDAKQVVAYFDEPFADAAMISAYYVSRAARAHVTVALSGDGADELFFGYPLYAKLQRMKQVCRLFPSRFYDDERMFQTYFVYHKHRIQSLGIDQITSVDVALDQTIKNGAEQMRSFDLLHTLPEYYLKKTDMASMMNGLEVRLPFLYRPFVEKMLGTPVHQHYRFGKGKRLLREAMHQRLPVAILNRRKQGFSRPVHTLLTDSILEEIKKRADSFSFIDHDEVVRIINEYKTKRLHGWLVWRLLVLAWWHEQYESYLR